MILEGLLQGLVYQLASFEEIVGVLGRHLVKRQTVSENLGLLLQHLELSGPVLAVIELFGGLVNQLLPLELLSAAC